MHAAGRGHVATGRTETPSSLSYRCKAIGGFGKAAGSVGPAGDGAGDGGREVEEGTVRATGELGGLAG